MQEESAPLVVVISQTERIVTPRFSMGTPMSPDGSEITVTAVSLLRDGQPWLPVAGEFHYARYPETEWRDALLKMKAGGIDIVASYSFWIHHEEEEGRFEWTGRRDLRRFVQLCADLGLLFIARIGPWCHGEVRNGGHPDWLVRSGAELRSDDLDYLRYAARFIGEIGWQLQGLLWKDGGPVIAVQCENEYGGPAEHLLSIKRLAIEAGLDVPLYTRTGWPDLATPMPLGELLPLFGGYSDGFWDRSLAEMPPGYRDGYLFTTVRADAAIATDQLGERAVKEDADDKYYPYFACEIGGGMERSYHRRIRIAPQDIETSALIKLGCGNNLQGYYMYHGGTNPDGKLSTLHESQATGMWNDLPTKSYDFQAPLGEFGQVRPHFHSLCRLHLFLRDFGTLLAPMPAHLPEHRPASAADHEAVRWAIRTDGQSGFLFVSNYQRLQPLPAKNGVQFALCLPGGCLTLPTAPITVPADAAFFWPFGMDLAGAPLRYATAQPVCFLEEQGIHYFVFAETPGVPTEFVFRREGLRVEAARGRIAETETEVRVEAVSPGTGAVIYLWTPHQRVAIVLLSPQQSLTCWKGTLAGKKRLFLSEAVLTLDGETLRLSGGDASKLSVGIFPAPSSLVSDGASVPGIADGLFQRFNALAAAVLPVIVTWEQIKPAKPARSIRSGKEGVAEAPADADFEGAAVWRLTLPPEVDPSRDLLLRLHYLGDAARITLNGKLLTDGFYNGDGFDLGLKRFAPAIYSGELLLSVLPLRRDAPIYLPEDAWPDFGAVDSVAALLSAEIIEAHQAEFCCTD